MPFILYSYIAAEILAPFFGSLLILNGILFTGKLMQVVDLIFSFNIGVTDFIRLSAYLLPNLLLFSVPMSAIMGVIVAFSRMNNDNEILALKAAGVSLYKIVPPIIVFGLCTALFTLTVSTKLIPAGSISMKHLFIKLITDKIEKGVIQEKRFSENTGDFVLYVDTIDPETKEWTGVYLSDLRDKTNPVTVLAKHGSLSSNARQMLIELDLRDGSLHRAQGTSTQTISFKQYTINIPIEPPKSIGGMSSTEVGKNDLSQTELLQQADKVGRDSATGVRYLIEYHLRIVLSVGCFILSLLGLPIAFKSRAGNRNFGIPLGLLFFIMYYVTITAAKGMCGTSPLPISVIMWAPNLIFGVFTLGIFSITAAEKWDVLLTSITKMFRKPSQPVNHSP